MTPNAIQCFRFMRGVYRKEKKAHVAYTMATRTKMNPALNAQERWLHVCTPTIMSPHPRNAGMLRDEISPNPGACGGTWNTSSLSDSCCNTPGETCGESFRNSRITATIVPSNTGSAVQQTNANQCLKPGVSLVTLAAAQRSRLCIRNM